ncbi:MAG: DUF4870 domain-containing protein [Roseiflexaceae bacterium]
MQPSEDERVLAALSHASIVANAVNLAGLIATSLIWTMHRDRSPYVRAHALQALVYQGAVLLIALFLALVGGLCLALSLLPALLRPDLYRSSPPSYSVWIGVLALLALIGFGVLAMIYGLYGAYRVYRGRSFRYLLIGRLVRPLLDAQPTPAPITPAPAAVHAEPSSPEVAPVAVEPPVAARISVDAPAGVVPPTMPKRRSRRSPSNEDVE